jgi:hypothetical protein
MNPNPTLFAPDPVKRVLLITYDLKTPGKVYNDFFQAIQTQGEWWHFLGPTWLIWTTKTSQQVYNAIVPNLTTKDSLLIVPIVRPYYGYLPKAAWDWMDERLPH